jgi:aromatic ring-opening dioxygenase catalytic subunit (LigB family)
MGRQPEIMKHMNECVERVLPATKPSAIVVLSAHWESQQVKITSSSKPSMYFDYYGFPKETYEYDYPAPGSPDLAWKIRGLLESKGISSELDPKRGLDHGAFIPLMLMYPEADIPVVQVSLDASLSSTRNIEIGSALSPLRDEGVLILGSGYTFHNMQAFFNPSNHTKEQSRLFNSWLQDTLNATATVGDILPKLAGWEQAPGARVAHPREEHLLPLFMTAAAAGPEAQPKLIWSNTDDHAVSSFMFE